MKILRGKDFEYRQLKSVKTGEEFSRSAVLSAALGSRDFFIHHEIIASGKRASAPHYHRQTDEFIYVLRGNLTIIEGEGESALASGDCAVFSADSKLLHHLENRSFEDIEVLVVSRRLTEPDVKYTSNIGNGVPAQ